MQLRKRVERASDLTLVSGFLGQGKRFLEISTGRDQIPEPLDRHSKRLEHFRNHRLVSDFPGDIEALDQI